MKKLNSFFLMGTVALAGLGVMSSCSSDDLGNDPTTNPGETKAVKTQFALNIPRANGGTRMSDQNAQANKNFLGMENIRMYSFKEEPTAFSTSTATFTLDKIASGISADASSKIYSDVSVPVGTTHFLFYAHAPQGTTNDVTNADNFTKGVLNFKEGKDNATATSGISAALVGVKGTDNGSADKLLAVLNAVAGVENWSTAAGTTELGKLYKNFITLKAGSANSIRLALQDLYNALGGVTTGSDADAKTIANNIRTAIKTDNVFTVTEQTNKTFAITTANTYPNNINLPDGAVELSFNATSKKFDYAATSGLTGLTTLDAAKICFPASIYYFQSSDLAATAAELDKTAWPKTTSDWTSNTVAPWLKDGAAGWTSTVQPTTRSIAMRKNINYGVANLATTVKCGAETLADNVDFEVSKPNEFIGTVTVPAAGFPVTGLLIGGQPTKVGFDFQPTSDAAYVQTIYDKNLTGIVAKNGAASAVNYTIVLPNDKGRGVAEQEKVNVAIELTNNSGVAFRGADGIIPAGGKFYLVGQLNPDAKTIEGVTYPAVFMSDYKTTLNLTITSLKNAYNTIPDLRSTKLQLGLSVDLEWQTGLQFDVNIE